MTDNEKHLATALMVLSEAITAYLETERRFEDGELDREQLEKSAIERGVYFHDNTSDYRMFEGIRSSMRADLLNMNGLIQDKIQ